jgi:hypothetical protein
VICGGYYADIFVNPGPVHGFLVVDSANFPSTIVSARLHVLMTAWAPDNDATEFLQVWDVSTPVATLVAAGSPAPVIADLGSGTLYANVPITQSLMGASPFDIELNAAGVAALANANGLMAFGISFATPQADVIQEVQLSEHAGRNALVIMGFE